MSLIVDLFCGGGGASEGIRLALGRDPDVAVNHDDEAVAMHLANHPTTRHHCGNVWDVDPFRVVGARAVDLLWLSPDCTHFSKAKGGKPRSAKRRSLAYVAVRWAKAVRPRVIALENVEEFTTWGPLGADGLPCPRRKGRTFRAWVSALRNLGYVVEWRELRACDYGAPTSRKRLFVVARCDGEAIEWPRPTHGPGTALRYRTAAECIDWSIPCPSIFTRERPLAEKTLARIARGIHRFVLNNPRPFIVPVKTWGGGGNDARSADEPMRTVTTSTRGEHAIVTPLVVPTAHAGDLRVHSVEDPLRTVTASRRGDHALVAPTLIQTGYGERDGQAPRSLDIREPLGTVVAGGAKHALVSAFIAKHYGDADGRADRNLGADLRSPLSTVTARDHHSLVTATLGDRRAEVRAFLTRFNGESATGGNSRAASMELPFQTVTTARRFGLVTVEGVDYEIHDIGMRMLQPRELFLAQGFRADYAIAPMVNGAPLTKTAQIRMCGNSVPPQLVAAIVGANVPRRRTEAA